MKRKVSSFTTHIGVRVAGDVTTNPDMKRHKLEMELTATGVLIEQREPFAPSLVPFANIIQVFLVEEKELEKPTLKKAS